MKGINGLILAIFLALAGAAFNFLYLASRSSDVNMVGFVAIPEGKEVKAGQRLTEDKLTKMEYTKRDANRLEKSAYPYDVRSSLIGQRVWHNLTGPTLVLRDDMQTPLVELNFGRNVPEGISERAAFVPVDTKKMVASLIEPGDEVAFVVPPTLGSRPTLAARPPRLPAGKTDAAKAEPPKDSGKLEPEPELAGVAEPASGNIDMIGPFTVLSVGNRLNKSELWSANRRPQLSESVLVVLVRVKKVKDDKDPAGKEVFLPPADRLMGLIETLSVTNAPGLTCLLYPRKPKSEE